jgi:hypothetical protein
VNTGARKAAPAPTSALVRVGGAAVAVALLATVAVLLVFGDRLVADGPAGAGKNDKDSAATPVEAEQQDEVVEAASAVLNRWSQPDLAYAEWWSGLKPLLTPGGREAYAFTDPAKVPELADLAADHVVLNPSGATATVWFETSDGLYGVDLSRKGATGRWLANRVVFPGGESMFA